MFNVNVQALVYNVDVNALSEVPAKHVNLNNQIKVETAQPPPSLDRTFGNDSVAIDGNGAGDTFLIVSRGGNQGFRAKRFRPARPGAKDPGHTVAEPIIMARSAAAPRISR
jgi:hypothetical protein